MNQDRIDGLITKVSDRDIYDEVAWVLNEPVVNFSQNVVDEFIQENASFHCKACLSPKIVRTLHNGACEFCQKRQGEHKYPGVKQEVFQRHRYCRCIVDYTPGDGKWQNVHNKKWKAGKLDVEEIRSLGYNKNRRTKESADKLQYNRYKSVLGDKAPKSFENFQDLKYNDSESYSRLEDNYEVKNNIKNGTYGSKINLEKQSPHNEETREKGKSYIYGGNDFAQELFNGYAGTGELMFGRKNQEICTADKIIGFDTQAEKETNMFKIHHSKKRTHIVPYYKKENNND